MPSYVFWNNKGGVGKSTLCFQLACAQARKHPKKSIYVVDLSPQCDVSRMFLGGGIHNGEDVILEIMQKQGAVRQTIAGFLQECNARIPTSGRVPKLAKYLIDPRNRRRPEAGTIPSNIRLLCGDFDLERTVQLVSSLAQPPLRGGRAPSGPQFSAYLLPRLYMRMAISELEKTDSNAQVFIDTDPYFNIATTHMGLLGADRWLPAFHPGSQASQYAVYRSIEYLYDATFGLSHEITRELNLYPLDWHDLSGRKLSMPSVSTPELFGLISNMTKPYAGRGAKPYSTPTTLHKNTIADVYGKARSVLTAQGRSDAFHEIQVWHLQRLGHICDYNGIDIGSLKASGSYPQPSASRKYPLSGEKTKVQLDGCKESLRKASSFL